MADQKWRTYEEVAVHLLNEMAAEFGLERVEDDKSLAGKLSGTTWKIEGKGFVAGGDGVVIIECRRYTGKRQSQEQVGALAWRILDTGAEGAILVSPLGLQPGAEIRKVGQPQSATGLRPAHKGWSLGN